MSPGRRTRQLAVLLAMMALAAVAAGPARAAYQATVDANVTAFSFNCIKINDTYPTKMLNAAVAGYRNLGFTTTGYSGAAFTRAHVLARTPADWGYYVHSHGDHYYYPDGGQYAGFKEDAGLCTGAKTVYSKDIAAARAGRRSNLVIMSTCHLGETRTTMPGAFGIPKRKAGHGRVGRHQLLPRVPGRGVGQRRVHLRDPLLERARARVRGRGGVRRREARVVQRGVRRQLVRQLRTGMGGQGPCRLPAPGVREVMTMNAASSRAPRPAPHPAPRRGRNRRRGDRVGVPQRDGSGRRRRPLRGRWTRHGADAAPLRAGGAGPGCGYVVPSAPRSPGAGRCSRRPRHRPLQWPDLR